RAAEWASAGCCVNGGLRGRPRGTGACWCCLTRRPPTRRQRGGTPESNNLTHPEGRPTRRVPSHRPRSPTGTLCALCTLRDLCEIDFLCASASPREIVLPLDNLKERVHPVPPDR